MKTYLKLWKALFKETKTTIILETLFASLFYTLFIIVPTILIFAQFISMFYHLLNFWVVLIIISVILINYLQLNMWKKALILKTENISVNINKLFLYQLIINSFIIVIIGILFIFVFIPMLQI
ncbi:MAG: hypothetical protein ACQERX_03365 [Bacillota bacterium]